MVRRQKRDAMSETYFDLVFLACDKNNVLFGFPSKSLDPQIQVLFFLNSKKLFDEISAEI